MTIYSIKDLVGQKLLLLHTEFNPKSQKCSILQTYKIYCTPHGKIIWDMKYYLFQHGKGFEINFSKIGRCVWMEMEKN